MVDIIYPLGVSSKWDNNEIRYSLRSIHKHLRNYRGIYIIGELPDFIQGVKHIPHGDNEMNKEANIKQKVLAACNHPDISENFLFFNDDHFILQDTDATSFPYFYKGTMEGLLNRKPRGGYYACVRRTYNHLRQKGLSTKYFDSHCPIIYNKTKFIEVVGAVNWETRCGMVIKSLYCNTLGIEGEPYKDAKVNKLCLAEELFDYTKDRVYFSIGDKAINDQLSIVLNTYYPEPSPWERS